jgi:SNF2 family DNA or RNA helicase
MVFSSPPQGKTIQTLALILANPPPKTTKHKTTLVVCPLGVLQQWVTEIKEKTFKGSLRVGIHHPSAQKLSAGQMSNLYDVVVTSFEMVTRESPHPRKATKPAASSSSSSKGKTQATRKEQPENERGPLFRMQFYRVILDEAHWIKNPSAERTRAVHELATSHRWCLTYVVLALTLFFFGNSNACSSFKGYTHTKRNWGFVPAYSFSGCSSIPYEGIL